MQCGVFDGSVAYLSLQQALALPALVDAGQGHRIVRVIAGYSHTCVEVTRQPTLRCFGVRAAEDAALDEEDFDFEHALWMP